MSKTKHGIKDPKKVRAGRMGGRVSGGNFKHNKEAAVMAGKRSAWRRNGGEISNYPLGLLDGGHEISFPDKGEGRARR